MKEMDLRKWHRTIGITAALFIILQTGSGFLLSLGDLSVAHTHANEEAYTTSHAHEDVESSWHEVLEFIHRGGSTAGVIYRIAMGICLLVMVVTGSMIFFKVRARSGKK